MSEKALGTRPLSDIVPMAELGLVARLRTIRVDRTLLTGLTLDRKSTRLNSSHSQISYAVFCLKKKNTANNIVKCRKSIAPHHAEAFRLAAIALRVNPSQLLVSRGCLLWCECALG